MTRFAFHEVTPELYQAQFALAAKLGEAPLIAPVLRDLIECRVSQINGCAYCVRKHSDSFAKHGGDQIKLTMLPVWQGGGRFRRVRARCTGMGRMLDPDRKSGRDLSMPSRAS